MQRFIALFLLLVLLGCGSTGPSTLWDPHLKRQTVSSSSFVAGREWNATVTVRAMRTTGNDGQAFALGLIVARSDLNYPRVVELRSYGKQLGYKRLDRHRIGTLRAETGLVRFSERVFRRLSKTGIDFRIYGKRGSYDVSVPARLFSEVLER